MKRRGRGAAEERPIILERKAVRLTESGTGAALPIFLGNPSMLGIPTEFLVMWRIGKKENVARRNSHSRGSSGRKFRGFFAPSIARQRRVW